MIFRFSLEAQVDNVSKWKTHESLYQSRKNSRVAKGFLKVMCSQRERNFSSTCSCLWFCLSSLAFSIQRLSATVFSLRVIAARSYGKQCGIYEIHTNRGNFGQAWYVQGGRKQGSYFFSIRSSFFCVGTKYLFRNLRIIFVFNAPVKLSFCDMMFIFYGPLVGIA